VNRTDLTELHFITPVQNLPSIATHGVLSHVRAERVGHASVANPEVQAVRSAKRTPGAGRPLHEYVNLYINARNAMMYYLICQAVDAHKELCILGIDTSVLDISGTFVTDRNAATMARFEPSPRGLALVDKDKVFATSWNHPTQMAKIDHKQIMQAELLVPDRLPADRINAVYISCDEAAQAVRAAGFVAVIKPRLFFRN